MVDVAGQGLRVRTALEACRRRVEIADSVELEQTIRFAQSVANDPSADTAERLKAGELLRKIHEAGSAIAMKLLEHERIDAGKATEKTDTTIEIVFDDAG